MGVQEEGRLAGEGGHGNSALTTCSTKQQKEPDLYGVSWEPPGMKGAFCGREWGWGRGGFNTLTQKLA